MQAFLTIAAEFVAVAGFALFAFRFVAGLLDRQQCPAAVPDVLIDGDELAAELSRIAAEVFAEAAPVDAVVPFTRKAPDLSGLNIRQLKAAARAVRLPKYNCDSKAVLQERLSALPAWTLREAIAL